MSQNIEQIFTANPASSMVSTDLLYLGRSPYGTSDDFAITWADLQTSITAVGTIASGTWNGGLITGTYGGTGVNNGSSTITIGGNVTFSGAHTFTGTITGNTSVTFPTSGTLATTSQLPTPAALTEVNDTNVTLTLGGTPSTALLQATSITAGWTGTLSGARGGTGTANTGLTINLGSASTGYVLTSDSSGNATWAANPGTGAVTTIDGDSGSATASSGTITISGGTTGLTTSGSSHTLSLTGTLTLANGGTNADLTASNGGIFYSTASAGAILAGTATANQVLLSGSSTTPAWSTATYPATTTVNQILYSSSANTIAGITTADNGVVITSSGGVPSISSTLPAAVVANIPGRLVSRTIYTTGSGTYTTPTGVTSILVEIAGGGGGGGSTVAAASSQSAAGGGAGGGYARLWIASASSTYSYAVGAGGAGATGSGGTGGTGGTTTFGSSLQATGGSGGYGAAAALTSITTMVATGLGGYSPGIGSNGDLNLQGAEGAYGFCQGGQLEIGGHGGDSYFGGGAPYPPNINTANNGITGGGGSGSIGPNQTNGGAGGNGVIYIWEFA